MTLLTVGVFVLCLGFLLVLVGWLGAVGNLGTSGRLPTA
jgi:hypothetical protein